MRVDEPTDCPSPSRHLHPGAARYDETRQKSFTVISRESHGKRLVAFREPPRSMRTARRRRDWGQRTQTRDQLAPVDNAFTLTRSIGQEPDAVNAGLFGHGGELVRAQR
jgi:hypothetical protein